MFDYYVIIWGCLELQRTAVSGSKVGILLVVGMQARQMNGLLGCLRDM
jgi:hypothetical protein